MNVLIQKHPTFNLLPLINYLHRILEANVGIFDKDVNPPKVIDDHKPDVIISYDNLRSQNVHDLITNANCAHLEHISSKRNPESNQFSFLLDDHPSYYPPRCNTLLMQDAAKVDRYRCGLSFIGPYYPLDSMSNSLRTAIQELNTNDTVDSRLYGDNQFRNTKTCGSIQEKDMSNLYRSSETVLIAKSPMFKYDFRALDCIYAGGIPILEPGHSLRQFFDYSVIDTLTFKDSVFPVLEEIAQNKADILEELKKIKADITDRFTWCDLLADLLDKISLSTAANKVRRSKKDTL